MKYAAPYIVVFFLPYIVIAFLLLAVLYLGTNSDWRTHVPYRESDMSTNSSPKYTWSLGINLREFMGDKHGSDAIVVAWAVYVCSIIGLLIWGGPVISHFIRHGSEVAWVKRELISYAIVFNMWLWTFYEPKITKEIE